MKFLHKLNGWLLKGTHAILVVLILGMVFLGFGQIVLRKLQPQQELLVKALTGIPLLLQHALVWVTALGAVVATHRRKHIKIDILAQVLSERKQSWPNRLVHTLGLFVCLVFAVGAWRYFRFADSEPLAMRASMLVGFVLIAFQFALNLIGEFFPEKESAG